jgi:hypothetical protein
LAFLLLVFHKHSLVLEFMLIKMSSFFTGA